MVRLAPTTDPTAGCGDPNDDIDTPAGRDLLLDGLKSGTFRGRAGSEGTASSSPTGFLARRNSVPWAWFAPGRGVGDDSGQTQFVCPQVVEDVESASQVSIEFEFQASRHIQPRGQLVEEPLAPPAVGLPCVGKPPGQIDKEALRFHFKKISAVAAEIVDLGGARRAQGLGVERGGLRVGLGRRVVRPHGFSPPPFSAREAEYSLSPLLTRF